MRAWLAALVFVALGIGCARAQAPVSVVVDGRFSVAQGVVLPVWSSAPLDRAGPGVTRAVILLHGLTRAADRYA